MYLKSASQNCDKLINLFSIMCFANTLHTRRHTFIITLQFIYMYQILLPFCCNSTFASLIMLRYCCTSALGYLSNQSQFIRNFFELERACLWDLHKIGLRSRLAIFESEYLRDRQILVRIGTALADEFYLEEGIPTGGVPAVTCFGLQII